MRFFASIIKIFVWLCVILIAAGAALFWFDTGSWLMKPLAQRAGNFFLDPMRLEIDNLDGSLREGYKLGGLRLISGDGNLFTLDYASVSPDWDLALKLMDGLPFIKRLEVRGVSSDLEKVLAIANHFSSGETEKSTSSEPLTIPPLNPVNILISDVNFGTPYSNLNLDTFKITDAGKLFLSSKIVSLDNDLLLKANARINFDPLEIISSDLRIGAKSTGNLSAKVSPLGANLSLTALSLEELLKFAPPLDVKLSGRLDGRVNLITEDEILKASGVISMPRASVMDIPLNFRLPFRWNGNNFIALDDATLNTSAASVKLKAEADIDNMKVKAKGEAQNISLSEIDKMLALGAGLIGEGGNVNFDVDTILTGDILSNTKADFNASMPSITAAGINVVKDLSAHVKLDHKETPKLSLGGQAFGGKLFARGEAFQDESGNIRPQAVLSIVNMDLNTLIKSIPAAAKSVQKPSGKITATAKISDALNVDAKITSDKISANGYTLTKILANLKYLHQEQRAALENFSAYMGKGQITVSGGANLKDTTFNAKADVKNFDTKIIPELKDVKGTYNITASAGGKYSNIETIQASANLTGRSVGYSGMTFGNLDIPITFANNQLNINNARSTLPGGSLNFRGNVNLRNTANPVLDIAASTQNLNLATVMKDFNLQNADMPVSGKLSGNFLVKGPLNTASVTANVSASDIKAGKVLNMPSANLEAVGNMQRVDVKKLNARVNGATINGNGNISMNQKNFADSALNVNMSIKRFDLKPTLKAANVDLPLTGMIDGTVKLAGTISKPELNLTANGITYDNKYTLKNIAAKLSSPAANHHVINAAATINNFRPELDIDLKQKGGDWEYQVDTKPMDIDKAIQSQNEEMAGIASGFATVSVKGSTKQNAPINITAKSRAIKIIDKIRITNINLPVTYSTAKNTITMTRGLASMNDGVINARMNVDMNKSAWDGHVNIAHLDLNETTKPFLPEGELVGKLTGEVNMKGDFGIMPMSFASGRFSTTPGYFHKMDLIESVTPTKKISFEKVSGTFFWDGVDLFLNPGTGATAGEDEPLYRYFSVNGSMGIPGKGLRLVCDGRFDLKLLDRLLGAMKGVFQYMTGGLTQSVLRDAAGRVLGIKKKDFQNVSFTLANSWNELRLLNLTITKPIEDFLPIDKLNKDQEEQKNDTQFRLTLKVPTGKGAKSVEEESTSDQFKQQLIDNLFNIGL